MQRGLILLGVSLLLLGGSVAALYHSFVKPLQIGTHGQLSSETEVFTPPSVVETQEKVDEQTGEVVTVQVERPAAHKEGHYNILVVGTDDDGTRTDTIMIAHLDTNAHTVALMSIPRDTVITGNYTVPKINGVYGGAGKGEKGIQALKLKLAQLLGFEVDGYALVDLEAFIQLVDLVGGVEFEVPMAMHYDDPTQDLYIHLEAGMQHLDGQKAMQLVRFRKGYATQDLQRTKTQQMFLQALAEKCVQEIGLAEIGELATIFKENVTTDMTLGNIAYLGQEVLKCDLEDMFSYTLEGEAVMLRDASCYAIYVNKTLDVVNQYFNPYDTAITAANVQIRTPEEIRAEQAAYLAQVAEQEALEAEEEDLEADEEVEAGEELPEDEQTEAEGAEDLTGEDGEIVLLPTDDWVVDESEEDMEIYEPEDTEEVFWPGR
ncbi:MAG: LCP family protein [Oscillospiraceae bacterium]|nr:LCP family protein [Oscillospiraceae bacterium]